MQQVDLVKKWENGFIMDPFATASTPGAPQKSEKVEVHLPGEGRESMRKLFCPACGKNRSTGNHNSRRAKKS